MTDERRSLPPVAPGNAQPCDWNPRAVIALDSDRPRDLPVRNARPTACAADAPVIVLAVAINASVT